MEIHESAEDYLETILILSRKNGQVRSIDICNELNFSKPSISVAMKKLRNEDYIRMDEGHLIYLTDKGREIAERVYERHCILSNLLMSMGVPEDLAREDACRMEHDLSETTFECIKRHYEEEHLSKNK